MSDIPTSSAHPTLRRRAADTGRRHAARIVEPARGYANRPRRGRYAAMIGIEYMASMALVVISAGLVGGEKKNDVLADPAIVLVRLTAVSFLFFLLALLSVGPRMGRLSATFGALVTTGIMLNSAGALRDVADLFGGKTASSSTPSTPTKGADTYGGGPTPGPVQQSTGTGGGILA